MAEDYEIKIGGDVTGLDAALKRAEDRINKVADKAVMKLGLDVTDKEVKRASAKAQKLLKESSGVKANLSIAGVTQKDVKAAIADVQKKINNTSKPLMIDVGLRVVSNKSSKGGVDHAVATLRDRLKNKSVNIPLGLRGISDAEIDSAIRKLQGRINKRQVNVKVNAEVVGVTGNVAGKGVAGAAGGAIIPVVAGSPGEDLPNKIVPRKGSRGRRVNVNPYFADAGGGMAEFHMPDYQADFLNQKQMITYREKMKHATRQVRDAVQAELEAATSGAINAYVSDATKRARRMANKTANLTGRIINGTGGNAQYVGPEKGVTDDVLYQKAMSDEEMRHRRTQQAIFARREMDRTMEGYISPESRSLIAASERDAARQKSLMARMSRVRTPDYVHVGHEMVRAGHQMMWTTTLPAIGAAGMALREYKEYDQQIGKIASLTNTDSRDVERIRREINSMAMGGNSRFDPTTLAEGYQQVAHFSSDVGDNMKVLAQTAKAASTGLGSVDAISDVVVSALNAYGGSADDASRYTDIILRMAQEGKGRVEQFGPALGRVMPVAATLGVSMEEVASNITMGTRIGMTPQEAANGLRQILLSIAKPKKETYEVMAAMGTTPVEMLGQLKDKGLAQVLTDVMDKTGGNTEAVTALFGNVRALTQVLASAGKQGDAYLRVLEDIQHAQGTTTAAQREAQKTLSHAMDTATASIKAASNAAINDLAPSLTEFIKGAQNVIGAGIQHGNTFIEQHPTAAKAAGYAGAAAVGLPVAMVVAGSVLQGAAELKKAGVTASGTLVPALGLAALAASTYATAQDNASSKTNQFMQSIMPFIGMAPLAYSGLGSAGRFLHGTIDAEGNAVPGFIGRFAGFRGRAGAAMGRAGVAYSAARLAGENKAFGALMGAGFGMSPFTSTATRGWGMGAGANAGLAALTAAPAWGAALYAAPLAVAGGFGYATWMQNEKARILGAEVDKYNRGLLETGVSNSLGTVDSSIGNYLSGSAQVDVQKRVDGIKEAYNKAMAEGNTALIESTSRQIQDLMNDIKLRTDISQSSKDAINSYLSDTFDKVYQLKIQTQESAPKEDFSPSAVAGRFFGFGRPASVKESGMWKLADALTFGASYVGRKVWQGYSEATYAPGTYSYEQTVGAYNSASNSSGLPESLRERKNYYNNSIRPLLESKWGVNGVKDVEKFSLGQLKRLRSELVAMDAGRRGAGADRDSRFMDIVGAVDSRIKRIAPAEKQTPLPYSRYGDDANGGSGSVAVPNPRLSRIAGVMDSTMMSILSFGNKTDEASMKLNLLKAAAEGLAPEFKEAALQLARYGDEQKNLEKQKNLVGGFLNSMYKGYLDRGIVPGGPNSRIAQFEGEFKYGDRMKANVARSIATYNAAIESGQGVIEGYGANGGFAGTGMSSGASASPTGEQIAMAAMKMQVTGASKAFAGYCQRLARITVQKVTHDYDKYFLGSAAMSMNAFKRAGIGRKADGTFSAGDLVYTGSSVGKGDGHVMIVGTDGMFYDQYGRRSKPKTRPEWVVSLGATGGSGGPSTGTDSGSRAQRAAWRKRMLQEANLSKLINAPLGDYSNAISLFTQAPDSLRKAFGDTSGIQNNPELHGLARELMMRIFGSEESLKTASEVGEKWIKMLRDIADRADAEFAAKDARRQYSRDFQLHRRNTRISAHNNKTIEDLILGGDYGASQSALTAAGSVYAMQQNEFNDPNSFYRRLMLSGQIQEARAYLGERGNQITKDAASASRAQALSGLYSMGQQSSQSVDAARAQLNAVMLAGSPEVLELNRQLADAQSRIRTTGKGLDSKTIEAAIDKSSEDIAETLRLGRLANYLAENVNLRAGAKAARYRNEGMAKGLRGTALEQYVGRRVDSASGMSIFDVEARRGIQGDTNAENFKSYLATLSDDHNERVRQLDSEFAIMAQYGLDPKGQDVAAGQEAVVKAMKEAKSLGVEISQGQIDRIRRSVEEESHKARINAMLRTQKQTEKDITDEIKRRNAARAVAGMGLPSALAAAQQKYQDARLSAEAALRDGSINQDTYNMRIRQGNEELRDTMGNYSRDAALAYMSGNVDELNSLRAQAAFAGGNGKNSYIRDAKMKVYGLRNATDAFGNPIGSGVDGQTEEGIMKEAEMMQRYADQIEETRKRWEEYNSTVNAVNDAVLKGMSNWKEGLSSLGDYIKNLAMQWASSWITDKIMGSDTARAGFGVKRPKMGSGSDTASLIAGSIGTAVGLFGGSNDGTIGSGGVIGDVGLGSWATGSNSMTNMGTMLSQTIAGGMSANTVMVTGNTVNVGGGTMTGQTAGSSPMSDTQKILGVVGTFSKFLG